MSLSLILCGFPYFAINLEILYEANIPYLLLVFPFLSILEMVFRCIILACEFSKKAMSLLLYQDGLPKNVLSIVMVSLIIIM